MSWTIHIELLSEAILGNGQSVPGEVDLDAVHDTYGFPFYGAKALKGHWREQTKFAANVLGNGAAGQQIRDRMRYIVNRAFGVPGTVDAAEGVLHFTNAMIPFESRKPFIDAVNQHIVRRKEIFQALTAVRSFTSIDTKTGTAEKHSLRKVRVVQKGLGLDSVVSGMDDFDRQEHSLLAAGIAGIRYIGMMKNRGKGLVTCTLRHNGQDITKDCLQDLRKWVIG